MSAGPPSCTELTSAGIKGAMPKLVTGEVWLTPFNQLLITTSFVTEIFDPSGIDVILRTPVSPILEAKCPFTSLKPTTSLSSINSILSPISKFISEARVSGSTPPTTGANSFAPIRKIKK